VTRRLTIITEIIAPYRIPVFNALAEHPEIDLHVIFLAETDPTQRQWLVYKNEVRFSYEVLPSWRRRMRKQNLLVNWGMTASLRRAAPDVIVWRLQLCRLLARAFMGPRQRHPISTLG